MALDLGFEEGDVYVLGAIEINGDRGIDRAEQMHVKVFPWRGGTRSAKWRLAAAAKG
jgi:hypothetical protein